MLFASFPQLPVGEYSDDATARIFATIAGMGIYAFYQMLFALGAIVFDDGSTEGRRAAIVAHKGIVDHFFLRAAIHPKPS